MKKILFRLTASVLCAAMLFGSTSCIGSFSLTNRLLGWNKGVGNKFVNELVFIAFWILPVYEVSGLADLLVLNSIEFWSGRNPMGDTAQADQIIEGSDGHRFLVQTDGEGYNIKDLESNQEMRLQYEEEDMSWNVVYDGTTTTLFTFVDDTHVRMPVGNDQWQTVELSQAGLYAYQAMATPAIMAAR